MGHPAGYIVALAIPGTINGARWPHRSGRLNPTSKTCGGTRGSVPCPAATPCIRGAVGGGGNLHGHGVMYLPGLYYERGLLHPFIDYDVPPPWLNTLVDPMDDEGNFHISPEPGLGLDINWDFINANRVEWEPGCAHGRAATCSLLGSWAVFRGRVALGTVPSWDAEKRAGRGQP
jgi:hypothetical protein